MRDTHPWASHPTVHLRDLARRMQARQERIATLEHMQLLDLDEGQWAALDWELDQARRFLADDAEAFDALLSQVARSAAEESPGGT